MPWAHDLENYGRDLSGGRPTMRDEWDAMLAQDYIDTPDPGRAYRNSLYANDVAATQAARDPWATMSFEDKLADPTSPLYMNTVRPQVSIDDPWSAAAPAPLPNLSNAPAEMQLRPEATASADYRKGLRRGTMLDTSGTDIRNRQKKAVELFGEEMKNNPDSTMTLEDFNATMGLTPDGQKTTSGGANALRKIPFVGNALGDMTDAAVAAYSAGAPAQPGTGLGSVIGGSKAPAAPSATATPGSKKPPPGMDQASFAAWVTKQLGKRPKNLDQMWMTYSRGG